VFVASPAGLFGQPEAAHYVAAKAGVAGLANVVAIEGAPHGIRANTVLPFGRSLMVDATAGDAGQIPEVAAFLDAIAPELVVPLAVYLASPACELTHHAFSACAGRFARAFSGSAPAGSPSRARPDGRGHRRPPGRGGVDRAVHGPDVDLRRGGGRRRPPRAHGLSRSSRAGGPSPNPPRNLGRSGGQATTSAEVSKGWGSPGVAAAAGGSFGPPAAADRRLGGQPAEPARPGRSTIGKLCSVRMPAVYSSSTPGFTA
jgi:hypothetical protein